MESFLTLEEVKEFLRIDDDTSQDKVLELMIKNALYYIEDGARKIDFDNQRMVDKAKLVGLILVEDFYENRILTAKPSEKTRYSVTSILAQLKYGYGDIDDESR